MAELKSENSRYQGVGAAVVQVSAARGYSEMHGSGLTGKRLYGMLHCAEGPAIERGGHAEYWLLGQEFEQSDYDQIVAISKQRNIDPSSEDVCGVVEEVLLDRELAEAMLIVFERSVPG